MIWTICKEISTSKVDVKASHHNYYSSSVQTSQVPLQKKNKHKTQARQIWEIWETEKTYWHFVLVFDDFITNNVCLFHGDLYQHYTVRTSSGKASKGDDSRQQWGSQAPLCFLGLKACHPFQEKAIYLGLQPSKGKILHSLPVTQFNFVFHCFSGK